MERKFLLFLNFNYSFQIKVQIKMKKIVLKKNFYDSGIESHLAITSVDYL
jgi:hypothetical protein